MKIIAPLSRLAEIEPLSAAGADEFYCSVVPDDWLSRFGTSATSRRPFGNLPNDTDLEIALKMTHDLGKKLSLVMNAQNYTAEQIECLRRLAARFAKEGGDALIIGDPALLSLIAAENYDMGLHVSSIAACRNKHSASFYGDLGATRIIFPRDMTLKEMHRICAANPKLQFEAFVLNDGCVFEEGVCHTIHLPGKLGGAICMDNYAYNYKRSDGLPLSAEESHELSDNDAHYAKWLWYRFGCGFSVTEEGYPFGPCGLCAMWNLKDFGLHSVKIAGRDAPLERKVKSVDLVRMQRDFMNGGHRESACSAFAQGIRKRPDLCHHGLMCYYPDALR